MMRVLHVSLLLAAFASPAAAQDASRNFPLGKTFLIIEGEAARLLLMGDGPNKQPEKKPAK